MAHQRQKAGGRSLHHHPLPCGAPTRRARRGRRPTALYRRGLGESVPTHVRCGFPVRDPATAGRAAPSDSAVLWLSNACTTCVRHPTFVRWPPIRRHERDPQRRKSSIDPAPAEAAVSSAAWLILSMTASRAPWRSTVFHHFRFSTPLWHGPAPAASSSSAASWKRRSPQTTCSTSSASLNRDQDRALFGFSPKSPAAGVCTHQCLVAWPPPRWLPGKPLRGLQSQGPAPGSRRPRHHRLDQKR